jgi:hypothetical protein
VHDKFDGDVEEPEIMETSAKEIPVDVVEGFFQIKFESYKSLLPFRSLHEMDNFLQNNRVI